MSQILRSRWFLITYAVIGMIIIINLIRSSLDLYSRRSIVQEKEIELRELEAEHAELTQELEYVQTDEFVEKEAREKLGLVKEGEMVVLVGELGEEPKTKNQEPRTKHQSEPQWKAWWRLFF